MGKLVPAEKTRIEDVVTSWNSLAERLGDTDAKRAASIEMIVSPEEDSGLWKQIFDVDENLDADAARNVMYARLSPSKIQAIQNVNTDDIENVKTSWTQAYDALVGRGGAGELVSLRDSGGTSLAEYESIMASLSPKDNVMVNYDIAALDLGDTRMARAGALYLMLEADREETLASLSEVERSAIRTILQDETKVEQLKTEAAASLGARVDLIAQEMKAMSTEARAAAMNAIPSDMQANITLYNQAIDSTVPDDQVSAVDRIKQAVISGNMDQAVLDAVEASVEEDRWNTIIAEIGGGTQLLP